MVIVIAWYGVRTCLVAAGLPAARVAVTEALASQMRKYKKVSIIAHSLGAWLLYKALAETPAGRERALAIYRAARPGYHAISVGTIDEMLAHAASLPDEAEVTRVAAIGCG